jgi:lipopolysaccharide/colanic/teichoic acid biosynthesis glycosyltransferase/glycosyltransferase involved in cell wall biosynthesis
MPRLLIVTTVPATLRAFLLPYARHFAAHGWQVDAMARDVSACADCRAAFQLVWDVDWTRNPFDLFKLARSLRQVREVVTDGGYDLVHVHTPIAAFVTRAALRRMRQSGKPKVIYTAHGFHFHSGGGRLRNAVFRALECRAGQWTDELVVINREDALAASFLRIVPREHLHFMTGIGVDTERYHPDRVAESEVLAVRSALGLAPGTPLFLVLGEFIPRKRHRDVIEALARLRDPRAHLALAGDGPLLETVRAQAARRGVAERVHFLGFRRDVPALVRASDAVVLVSQQEGLPRSVLEALCLKRPVIGSDIRGTRELLEDGAGWLVPVGDADALARAMSEVTASPEKARARGRRGRLKVMEGYDQASILQSHEELYTRVLAAPQPLSPRERVAEGRVRAAAPQPLSPWERVAEGRVRAAAPPSAGASPCEPVATALTRPSGTLSECVTPTCAATLTRPSDTLSQRERVCTRRFKRAFDLVVALTGLLVLSPLLGVLALCIRLNMGSPVFFRQRRPGRGGVPFRLVKFRTMRTALGPDGRPLPDAERLTRLGRFLRATSLDELPQLWNVLKGELSLVGPRPLLMEYLALYTPDQARRHEVRPGITGWAQVNGRNALSWEQKFAHDVWYVDHWSLGLDLKILGLTVLKVLRREGVSAAGEATTTPFRGTHHAAEANTAWKPSGSSAAAATPRL